MRPGKLHSEIVADTLYKGRVDHPVVSLDESPKPHVHAVESPCFQHLVERGDAVSHVLSRWSAALPVNSGERERASDQIVDCHTPSVLCKCL